MDEKANEENVTVEVKDALDLPVVKTKSTNDDSQPFQLKVETLGVIASILISLVSLLIALVSIAWDITEFSVSNQSKLLGQCAVEANASTTIRNSRSSPVFDEVTGKYLTKQLPAEIIVETKCILFNDGLKRLSVLNAQSVLIKDGKEGDRRVRPLALIESDVISKDASPIKIEPGESKVISVYSKIHISLESRKREGVIRAFDLCSASSTEGFSNLSRCLSSEGFGLSDYLYEEPFPSRNTQGGGIFNGIGIQFITDSNIASIFEVTSLGLNSGRKSRSSVSPYYLQEGEVTDLTSDWP